MRRSILATIGLLVGAVSSAHAATFTVNTTADTYDGICDIVDCSLKDAIDDAVATSGADSVVLAPNATYTVYTPVIFTWGVPQITDNLTIVGNGAVVERFPSAPAFKLFRTNGNGTLTLQNLTVRNGRDTFGGCIENHFGALHIVDSIIENCVATQSNGSGGGGIYSSGVGPITITRSTIRNNSSASSAGGLFAINYTFPAQVTLVDSAFIGNAALDPVNGLGGAIQFAADVDATITSTTFSGNFSASMAGAIGFNSVPVGRTIDLVNVTIVNNTAGQIGGGIGAGACSQNCPNVTKPRLINTILANNTATANALTANCFSTFDSGGNNIFGPPVVNNVNCTILNQTNEILLTGVLTNISGLDVTGNPGGEHHDLLAGNVGINNANASCPATDQIGFGRVVVCERGAIEYRPPAISPCQAEKKRCLRKKVKGLLTCHAKAEKGGVPVDQNCLNKKYLQFAECCHKAEALDCPTAGDCDALEAKVDAFVLDVVQELDPSFPAPVQNLCSAAKKRCVMKKAAALLKCHAKAEEVGALSAKCVGKAHTAFDGGAIPSKSCFYPLEASGNCLTYGDTATMEAKVDAFIEDVICELDPFSGHCNPPTPTPVATPTPSDTPTPTATATPPVCQLPQPADCACQDGVICSSSCPGGPGFTCAAAQQGCINLCTQFHGGPGQCPGACTDCATGLPCQ